jgi:hypothetical protein
MSLQLLPDDPETAEHIVRLLETNHALLKSLKRTVEERDYWRDCYYQMLTDREVRHG